jgi:hypothetical protein
VVGGCNEGSVHIFGCGVGVFFWEMDFFLDLRVVWELKLFVVLYLLLTFSRVCCEFILA